jgi:hypothetical protein
VVAGAFAAALLRAPVFVPARAGGAGLGGAGAWANATAPEITINRNVRI